MGEKKPSKYTTDDLSDVTVFRELEKMKKFILDNIYGKLISGMQFDYGGEEEPNKVILTITFNDETSVSASFEMNTIFKIDTEMDGDILYLVVTMTNGTIYKAPIDTSEFVTISGNQTVTGDKLFVGDVQVPDIEHGEGEEQIQETNKAVNERFFKIHGSERIDSIEDELGDVGQEGTVRGDLAQAKTDIENLEQEESGLEERVTAIEDDIGDVGQEGTVRGDLATLKNDMTQAKEDIVSAFDDIRYLDDNKQTKLVGGTNIKNINSHDIMGAGNIEVQEVLESGVNIKTINQQSILGSGDIPIGSSGNGYWRTPTSFADLVSAMNNYNYVLVGLSCTITSQSVDDWSSQLSNPTFTMTSLSHKCYTVYGGTIVYNNGQDYISLIRVTAITSSTIRLQPIVFNGSGSKWGSSITLSSSNYTDYISLSDCRIWVNG